MKSVLIWICIGLCVILFAWCNLNTYFIKMNTNRIETLERHSDTIYVLHSWDIGH